MIKYTVEDYLQLPYQEVSSVLWELIDGVIQMAPSPNLVHQKLSLRISSTLYQWFRDNKKHCEIFTEPADVFLKENLILKPDIFVVCDLEKLTTNRCNGIPDLVIEILSPRTKNNDLPGGAKFRAYEEFLLKEYWIVDPLDERNITLTQFVLEDETLTQKQIYTKHDIIQSHIFPDMRINLEECFSL